MAADFSRVVRTPVIEVTDLTRERNDGEAFQSCSILLNQIAEVPTLAIELVTMIENTSVLHDEFIGHRLGLLPIDSSRIRDYKYKEDCSCADRCRNCCVEFQLDVMCRNDTGLTVTHLDIIGTDPHADSPMPVPRAEESGVSATAVLFMTMMQSGIAIAKLRKNQRIKCDLVATKGIGKLHAKWIPAATAVFQYEPEIFINDKLLETVPQEAQQAIAKACPHRVFSVEQDMYTPQTLAVENKMACIFCNECTETAKELGFPDLIHVSHKPDVFRFVVESTGSLPAELIVEIAFEVLDKKLKTILTETSKLEGFTSEEAATYGAGRSRKRRGEQKSDQAWDDFVLDLS